MNDAVAEVKARVQIVDVIAGYVRLQRGGREHKGLCPFHAEKTPSFTVNSEHQVWYCHGCHEGGDVLSFVQRVERVDFPQALGILAERAGIELKDFARSGTSSGNARKRKIALDLHGRAQSFFEHVLWETPAGKAGRTVLEERHIEEKLARAFGIGFAPAGGASGDALLRYVTSRGWASASDVADCGLVHPLNPDGHSRDRFRNRLVFPIRDERGHTIAFGARSVDESLPKYLNSPGTVLYDKSRALFGIDRARSAMEETRQVVVVEGYFDVLALHRAGITDVVASSGTAFTAQQASALGRYVDTVILCFDDDSAGRIATSKAASVLAEAGLKVRICQLPGGWTDPDDAVNADPAALVEAVQSAEAEWKVLIDRAVGDAEGGGLDDRRSAAERVTAVLAQIPEAASREIYLQQAARRLEIARVALAADVTKARQHQRRETAFAVAPAQVASRAEQGLAEAGNGQVIPAWELFLGSIAVQRPDLVSSILGQGLNSEQLESSAVRHIMDVAGQPDVSVPFPMHVLNTEDQKVAALLLMRHVPELDDPVALSQATADCVRLVGEGRRQGELAAVQRELREARDEGRREDADELAARLHALAVGVPHLRRSVGSDQRWA